MQSFAASHVYDIRIAERDSDRADRSRRLVVPDAVPGGTGIGRLPNAAVDRTQVESGWLAGHARQRTGATGANRPYFAPAHIRKEFGIHLSAYGGCQGDSGCDDEQCARAALHNSPILDLRRLAWAFVNGTGLCGGSSSVRGACETPRMNEDALNPPAAEEFTGSNPSSSRRLAPLQTEHLDDRQTLGLS